MLQDKVRVVLCPWMSEVLILFRTAVSVAVGARVIVGAIDCLGM